MQLLDVASRLSSNTMVCYLAARLGVPDYQVETAINCYSPVTEAARHLLFDWRKTVATDAEAFQLLTRALRECRQLRILSEVFGITDH